MARTKQSPRDQPLLNYSDATPKKTLRTRQITIPQVSNIRRKHLLRLMAYRSQSTPAVVVVMSLVARAHSAV